jgi:hypothetical protein
MMAPARLTKSAYMTVQDGKPSTFVRFMFSTMGVAEWPESEETAERNPGIKEQATAAGQPLMPKGVSFFPNTPNPARGKQIVIMADDARGVVIVEAFETPEGKPVLTEEIPLPPLRAAQ